MSIMQWIIKIGKYSLITVTGISATVFLLVGLLLFTHPGNQLIIKLAEQFESRLSIELVEGSLFRSPIYRNIGWHDGQTMVDIDAIHYQFDWTCLTNTLCLKKLSIEGANIAIDDQQQSAPIEVEEQQPVEPINIPIKIIIDQVSLKQFKFVMGELIVDLDSLSLTADALYKDISLSSQISGLLVTLPDRDENVATDTVPAVVNSEDKKRLDLNFAHFPAILTEQMLPNVTLPINLAVAPISIDNVKIIQNNETLFQLDSLQSAFTFNQSQLSITQFLLDIPETSLNLHADINFVDQYPLDIKIDGKIKQIKQLTPSTMLSDLHFKFNSQGDLANLSSELILSNKIDLQLRSHLDLFSKNLPHTVQLDWQNLQWPLTGDADYQSVQGSFTSEGSLLDNHIQLYADYLLTDQPGGKVSLTTKGALQQLEIESLKVETLDGAIDFKGLLTWVDDINWLGELRIDNIDLAQLETQYSGQLSGLITQQASVTLYENSPPEWQFNFPELNLDGVLLDRPLTASGRVSGNYQQGINFDQLAINNAQNSFIVNGLLAQENDLSIALKVIDLSHAVIGAQGDIEGDIQIKGPFDKLQILSQLDAQALSYQQYQLQTLSLDSHVILSEKPQLTLNLSANDIMIEKQLIDSVEVQISNQPVTNSSPINSALESQITANQNNYLHKIKLMLNSELLSSELLLHLTQSDDLLLTQLNQASLYLPYQQLTLNKPVDLIAQDEMFNVTAHCWQASITDSGINNQAQAGKLCINNLNIGESGQANISVDSYLLANVNPYLPEQLQMHGALSAEADVSWLADENPNFKVELYSDDMLVQINNDAQEKNFIDYPMKKFTIEALGDNQKVQIDANIFADDFVDINLKGQLFPYLQQPSIDSSIDISFADFSLFLPLIPQLEQLKGQLTSQLTLVGDLNKPAINGSIIVQSGEVSGADIPMKISELQSEIIINESHASLAGSFNTSDSNTLGEKIADIPLLTGTINIVDRSLKKVTNKISGNQPLPIDTGVKTDEFPGVAFIQGSFDWSTILSGEVHLYGNKLEIYDYGKIDLHISPDIQLSVADNVNINGSLYVDQGKIEVKEVPAGAISPSKDIVVVDIENKNAGADLPVIIDLSVDMGNKFQIVALGLDTFIDGKLLIKKPLTKELSINGKLNLDDGSYRSFGQQLVLQDSSVAFHGAPESPYLSIEAVRDPDKIEDDVTAGVRVTGTPDDLELVIFSDPAMAQQEALSYLTRGQSLDSSSGSGGTMANMLIDLAAGQSGGVMSTIGEGIGIKDLSLSSSGTGDEQSVGVRGEVAPGVEISYGVGVFDSFSIFALRYEVFEQFYIEASTGIDQAVDAYYEWDWGWD